MTIEIRRAVADEAPALARLGRDTFVETFVDRFQMPYPPEDLEVYLAEAYAVDRVATSLTSPTTAWWTARRDEALCGFAMAGPGTLPHPDLRPGEGELKRLYVREAHQGFAVGRALLDASLAWLETTFAGAQWLGVWSGNEKAKELYARRGFVQVGAYEFPVGRVRDHELIYRRPRPS